MLEENIIKASEILYDKEKIAKIASPYLVSYVSILKKIKIIGKKIDHRNDGLSKLFC